MPWVDGWLPGHILPRSPDQVRAELDRWTRLAEPVGVEHAAVMIEQTVALWNDRTPKNWSDIADFYLEAVEDMPPDLLDEALREVRLNSRFFPTPADIRAPVLARLERRKRTRDRLGTMLAIAGDGPHQTDYQRARQIFAAPVASKAGGHDYPGTRNPPEFFTSDCANGCGCWMGEFRSGGPEGVDPFGACPKAGEG